MKITFELTMDEVEKKITKILYDRDIKLNSIIKFFTICIFKTFATKHPDEINLIFDRFIKTANAPNSSQITIDDLIECFFPGNFPNSTIFNDPGVKDNKCKYLLSPSIKESK